VKYYTRLGGAVFCSECAGTPPTAREILAIVVVLLFTAAMVGLFLAVFWLVR
jgi:hypothetical protein